MSERKARRVGRKLAEIIQRGEFGRTSIVLIGFSLGTRVINYCLKSLYETAPGIISEVYLLGGASPNKTDNW